MAFDSLFTGISGLNAYQSQIDMISNNIANVGTVGFKGQRMTFADQYYQSLGYATGPSQTSGGVNPQDIGLGVKVNTVDTNFQQGGLETTGINTDLAINGDGFFILRNANGSASPISLYTRDGAFSLNSNGLLYDPGSGLAVQGYMAGKNGQVTSTGSPGNITIPLGLVAQATGTGFGAKIGPSGDANFDMQMGGNLDQTQWQLEEQGVIANPSKTGLGAPDSISTSIYDSLGNVHKMNLMYVPDASGATPAAGTLTNGVLSSSGGNVVAAASLNPGQPTPANITVTVTGGVASVSDGTTTINNLGANGQTTIDGVTLTLGNFTAADNGTATYAITAGATTGLPSSVQDADGASHTPATRWKVQAYFDDGTQIGGQSSSAQSPATIGYAYFDQNGQFINTSSSVGTPGAALTANIHQAGQPPSAVAGNQLNITTWGLVNGNQPVGPTGTGSPSTGPIGLDFSDTTALAASTGSSTVSSTGYTASVVAQNGYAAGTLSNITIGQDGVVSGAFTNGQTKSLAQLALATFQNEGGLHRIGSNQFQATANSGLAQIGTGAQGRFGAVISGSLEESNVSLADEFTKMIVAQRAFEANTRGISTADQNMQTVLNIRASSN